MPRSALLLGIGLKRNTRMLNFHGIRSLSKSREKQLVKTTFETYNKTRIKTQK